LLGIDLLKDLHRLTMGMSLSESNEMPVKNWLVLLEGSLAGFQMNSVVQHQIESNPGAKVKVRKFHGARVHVFKIPLPGGDATQPMKVGLAKLGTTGVLAGDARSVKTFLSARTGKSPGLRANPKLSHVASRIPSGSTFWLAAVPERVVAKVKDLQKIPGLKNLPKLQGMLLSGRLDKDLMITGLAWAQDDQTARMLGDIVRGLVALVQFVPIEDPFAKKLVQSLRVQTDRRQVTVSATLSGDLIAKHAAAKGEPGEPIELRVVKGRLTIKTRQTLDVFIDGKKVGRTPMKRFKVKPGNHLLKLKNSDGKQIVAVKLEDKKDVIIIKNMPGGHDINVEIPNPLPVPPVSPLPPEELELPAPPEPPAPVEPLEPAEPVGPH
jgi:hypothetical protein